MINRLKKDWITHIVCLLLTLFYFWGIDLVPFHPDESTQIFMSQDLFDLFEDPLSLSYSPDLELNSKMTYRAIDAPLTRYLIGFARYVTNSQGLTSDWDWSFSWKQNLDSGAYPSPSLLTTARFIPALLVPISLYLFYFSVRKVLPKFPAVIALVYLGLNPLILLHGRRAMAEPALLFGIVLFLWTMTQDRIKPVMVGIALAIAFNAKQTGAILIPVGIIAVCLAPDDKLRLKNMLARSAVVLTVLLLITFILNPYYWKSPLAAIFASTQARSQLLDLQLMDHLQGTSPNILTLLFSLVSNLFISPPAVSEITKFLDPLAQQIEFYQGIIFHVWGRNLITGALLLSMALSGFYVLFKRYPSCTKILQQKLILLVLTSASLIAGILVLLPIPWQRYIIPLLPLSAFWLGYALLPLSEALERLNKTSKLHPGTSDQL